MAPVIEITNLTKRFSNRLAVDHLNLQVEGGDIYGFVGPNGAGKTTTIRMLTTLLKPTEGQVRINGFITSDSPREIHRMVGYMPDTFGIYPNLRVWEYLDFFAACYGIGSERRTGIVFDLIELVDLSHHQLDYLGNLSLGMKQRLSLARCLIHDPTVLILDEPAAGLDPRARLEFRELFVELARLGKTIFFSTHILADVTDICTRVGIIDAGKLVAQGTLEELKQQLNPHRNIHITFTDRSEEATLFLDKYPGIISVKPDNQTPQSTPKADLEITFNGTDSQVTMLLNDLIQQGYPILQFFETGDILEDVFLRVTKGLTG